MFEIFGEFDSVEELNAAAEGQKEEGDSNALIDLALENGLDKEDAQDYAEGILPCLATPLMAAIGKLNIESQKEKNQDILYIIEHFKTRAAEKEEVARAIRRKGKSAKKAYEAMREYCKKSKRNGISDREGFKYMEEEYYRKEGGTDEKEINRKTSNGKKDNK